MRVDRDEAQRILDESKSKRDAAVQDRNRLVEEARGIDMDIEAGKYEEIAVKILAYDELIKSLDAQISEAQETLDR